MIVDFANGNDTAGKVATVEMENRDALFLLAYALTYFAMPIPIAIMVYASGCGAEFAMVSSLGVLGITGWRAVFEVGNAFCRLEVDREGMTRVLYWTRRLDRVDFSEITKIARFEVREPHLIVSTRSGTRWVIQGWHPSNRCDDVFNLIHTLWSTGRAVNP